MNKRAASKEDLLETAREIAYQEGLSSLSIRRLAMDSGIAIGTVYNYFPSKADLVAEVMEDFWRNVFHGGCFNTESRNFIESVEEIHRRLRENLIVFKKEFLEDVRGLSKEEKAKSHQVELMYMEHMKAGILRILNRDTRITEALWTEEFTKERLVEFTFSNMMVLLSKGESELEYFKMILARLLYTTYE